MSWLQNSIRLKRFKLLATLALALGLVIGLIALVTTLLANHPHSDTGSRFVGVKDNAPLDSKYTCNGDNLSPAIEFTNIPAEAKALALTMENLDLPKPDKDNNPWHANWVMWNIDPKTTKVPEGTAPSGSIGRSIDGNYKYYGPCPEKGQTLHYQLNLYSQKELISGVSSSDPFRDVKAAIEKQQLTLDSIKVTYTGQ